MAPGAAAAASGNLMEGLLAMLPATSWAQTATAAAGPRSADAEVVRKQLQETIARR